MSKQYSRVVVPVKPLSHIAVESFGVAGVMGQVPPAAQAWRGSSVSDLKHRPPDGTSASPPSVGPWVDDRRCGAS
jgi:hypothetical protein